MKKFILTCLVSLASFSFFAQETPILTEEQNKAWVQELQQEKELDEQLELLRERISSDSSVYFRLNANPHGKNSAVTKEYKEETRHRPLYLFSFPGGSLMVHPNPSEDYLVSLQEVLKPEHVSHIKITTGVMASALYGSRGRPGVIEIYVRDKAVLAGLAGL